MGLISLIISFILFVLSLFNKKNKYFNPNVIFFGLWFIILFLSNLSLYGLNKPSGETYWLLMNMLLFYYIGSIVGKINVKHKERKKNVKYKLNYPIIYILALILIVLLIIDSYVVLKQLINGIPMWRIRDMGMNAFSSEENTLYYQRTFWEETIRQAILAPFSLVFHAITGYIFFNSQDNKNRIRCLILSIIILVLSSFSSGGGRLLFLYFVICFFSSFVLSKRYGVFKEEKYIKYKNLMLKILAISFIFVLIFTNSRTSSGFVKQAYTYFALPPTLLDAWLPVLKDSCCTFGLMTTFGVHTYIFRGLEYMHMNSLIPLQYYEAYKNVLNIAITKDVGFRRVNGFVTPVYYFYLDGGFFGVVLFSFIFGFIVNKVYKNISKNVNERNFVTYVLIIYGVFVSFIRIQTAIPSFIIAFVLQLFIIKKQKGECYEK